MIDSPNPDAHRTPRGSASTAIASLLILCLTTGCPGGDSEPKNQNPEWTLKVTNTGHDPAPAGTTQPPGHATLEIRSSATAEGVGPTRQSDLPGVRVQLTFEANPHDPHELQLAILGVTLLDQGAPTEREAVLAEDLAAQDVTVLRGTFRSDSADGSSAVDFPAPGVATRPIAELLRQIEQALAIVTLPTPDEPLGDGSSWSATRRTELAGVTWDQTLSCTANRADSADPDARDRFSVGVTSTFFAAPQPYLMDGIPTGARAEITDARAELRGTWTGYLGAALPDRADFQLHIELSIRVHHDGEPSEVHIVHQSSLRFAAED